MGYATIYLVHFLIFAPLTIICYIIDVITPATGCDPPENPETAGSILMVAQYLYIGCTALSLLITALVKYFSSKYLPGDFGKMGRLPKCLGFFLRVFLMLLNIAHWALVVPMGYFIIIYLSSSECYARNMGTSRILLLIVPIVWLLQHCGGTIVRSFIDIDTFLIVPENPEGSKIAHVLLVTCGP